MSATSSSASQPSARIPPDPYGSSYCGCIGCAAQSTAALQPADGILIRSKALSVTRMTGQSAQTDGLQCSGGCQLSEAAYWSLTFQASFSTAGCSRVMLMSQVLRDAAPSRGQNGWHLEPRLRCVRNLSKATVAFKIIAVLRLLLHLLLLQEQLLLQSRIAKATTATPAACIAPRVRMCFSSVYFSIRPADRPAGDGLHS